MNGSTDGTSKAGDRSIGVIRVTTFRARAGQITGLQAAAEGNAREARHADGCESAEVCSVPEDAEAVLVVSRWASEQRLRAFLDWHQGQAHGAVSPYTVAPPHSVHYPVITADR